LIFNNYIILHCKFYRANGKVRQKHKEWNV
jgi:hypothetical protein